MIMQNSIAKQKMFTLPLLLALILLMASMGAMDSTYAQTMDLTVTDIEDAAGSSHSDDSRQILEGLLGDFANSPLTASTDTSSSLLSSLFLVFNVVLFTVGVAFMTYSMVMAIAVSAHEGEVMGKRMSSLWVPIRFGVGIFGMIPAFHGFSLAQAVMMYIAILGIGLANMLTDQAIDTTADLNPFEVTPAFATHLPMGTVDADMAKSLFAMHVCAKAHIESRSWFKNNLVPYGSVKEIFDKEGIYYRHAKEECGGVSIINAFRSDENWLSTLSFGLGTAGFRNNAVDYTSINVKPTAIAEINKESLGKLNDVVKVLAFQWYDNRNSKDQAPMDVAQLIAKAGAIKAEHDEKIAKLFEKTNKNETLKKGIKNRMKEGGWTSIGAWYSTFAEVTSTVQSAAMSSRFHVLPIGISDKVTDDQTKEVLQLLAHQWNVGEAESGACLMGLFDKNPTGNCSAGQSLFINVTDAILGNTGGEGMVNPIIAVKNIGDWMLVVVGTVLGVGFLDFLADITPQGKALGFVSDAVSKVGSSKIAESKYSGLTASVLGSIFTMLLILGIIFAVYIPFVPYLTWFSALVSYFASVLEGLVAAQVWAFTHLSTEGEGMGQRAERGYLFILNMLLRPGLMVMGFFIASGILTLLGTLFFTAFGSALANAQGNTMTGPIIMFGLMGVVGLAMLTLIQTTFNLIYEIPDRVIAWFGGGMEARMAKEMDSHIERGAKTMANWAGGSALGGQIIRNTGQTARNTGGMGGGGRGEKGGR